MENPAIRKLWDKLGQLIDDSIVNHLNSVEDHEYANEMLKKFLEDGRKFIAIHENLIERLRDLKCEAEIVRARENGQEMRYAQLEEYIQKLRDLQNAVGSNEIRAKTPKPPIKPVRTEKRTLSLSESLDSTSSFVTEQLDSSAQDEEESCEGPAVKKAKTEGKKESSSGSSSPSLSPS